MEQQPLLPSFLLQDKSSILESQSSEEGDAASLLETSICEASLFQALPGVDAPAGTQNWRPTSDMS